MVSSTKLLHLHFWFRTLLSRTHANKELWQQVLQHQHKHWSRRIQVELLRIFTIHGSFLGWKLKVMESEPRPTHVLSKGACFDELCSPCCRSIQHQGLISQDPRPQALTSVSLSLFIFKNMFLSILSCMYLYGIEFIKWYFQTKTMDRFGRKDEDDPRSVAPDLNLAVNELRTKAEWLSVEWP